jgi:hypothetical protein
VLASVTRAVHRECPRGIEYHSIASGRSEREIVPFALIDNGLRWHVRAFDRKSMVPHPYQPRPEITQMDYGMVRGSLWLKLRAATAGYILRQWSVDCSPDHSLRGHEFRRWLKDRLALYGVRNAVLAPGYRSPDQSKGEQ